jgi:hypothetical protein
MATEFLGLFEQLIHRCNEELEIVAITARGIWARRNDVVHGGTFMHPCSLAHAAENQLMQWRQATEKRDEQVTPLNPAVIQEKWKPPHPAVICIKRIGTWL